MQLPGGLWEHGESCRGFDFAPFDGRLELAIAQAGIRDAPLPVVVTDALEAALASLAGGPPTADRVANLCVPDRQFLTRSLEMALDPGDGWRTGTCVDCETRFDIRLRLADLPVAEAGDGYPFADVAIDGHKLRFRVPTGRDQEAIASCDDGHAATLELLHRCHVNAEDGSEHALSDQLSDAAVGEIERSLDAVAPGVVTEVRTCCPECNRDCTVEIDPYAVLQRGPDRLLREVHRIARAYHWSEEQILALPRARRRWYLAMIDRDRGSAR